jgi:hypothetical protein
LLLLLNPTAALRIVGVVQVPAGEKTLVVPALSLDVAPHKDMGALDRCAANAPASIAAPSEALVVCVSVLASCWEAARACFRALIDGWMDGWVSFL